MKTENKLERLDEFQEVLQAYRPSDETARLFTETQMVLLVGPTASGRNTLIAILVQTGRYHQIISTTTRMPRENNGVLEQNGVEYWFTSEDEFLRGLQAGEYLEAAIIHGQQVSGIKGAELQKAYDSGKIAIDEIEVAGGRTLHRLNPNAVFVFLLPPTFEIWMSRLTGRGQMTEQEVIRRFRSAQAEIQDALESDFYHFVINNEIHEAAMAVDELANGREPDPDKQARGRDHAERLLIDIQLYLGSS